MFVPNRLRPFPHGTVGDDSTQESARPPAAVLDAATNTLTGKLDSLRGKLSAAGRALEILESKENEGAAEKADLRAAADAAAAGTAIPGHTAREQRLKDIEAKHFEIEALRKAIEEAIAALNVKRSALGNAGSADTNTAATDLAAAIDALAAKFNTYATLEARDAWFHGSPYAIRNRVTNLGLIPGLYSPANTDGQDTTPVSTVITQLKNALGKGV